MKEWSLDEARAALAEVRPLVERLRELAAKIGAAPASNGHGSSGNGHHAPPRAEVQAILTRLTELGIEVRDPARGLIDFPARSPSGRPYYLCWLAGEADLDWWHWIEAGFAGRTPISDPPE